MDKIYQRQGIRLGKSFLAAWAFLLVCGLHTGSIMACLFFAAAYILFGIGTNGIHVKALRILEQDYAGAEWPAALTALVLDILWILGRLHTITEGLENRLFCTVLLLAAGTGLFFVLEALLKLLFAWLRGREIEAALSEKADKKAFIFTFTACLLCWLPYFLANFPAVMTVDSFNQYAQAVGIYAYSNHHPWVHTMFIKLCITIGSLFTQDASSAIAVYTVLQMIFLAACAAYLVDTARQCGAGRKMLAAFTAFYAILPFQGMFAVTMWKDILFAGAFLLFGVTLFKMALAGERAGKGRPAVRDCILFIVSGILVCLLRSNGWYAFLLSVPVLIFFFRKKILFILPMNLCVIGIVMLVKGPVMGAFGVVRPDLAESLSIPLQQVARVLAMERSIAEEDQELLARIMDTEEAAAVYEAGSADNIKRLVRRGDPAYLEEHMEEYRGVYLRLARAYPADYYEAWTGQTSAYWCPEIQPVLVFNEGVPENEFGLEGSSLFRGQLYMKLKEIFFKLYGIIPVYGLFFSIGAYTWLMIIGAGACIACHKYVRLAVYLPGLALIATLLIATPLNGEFRYAYGVIFSMPLYVLAMGAAGAVKKKEREPGKEIRG